MTVFEISMLSGSDFAVLVPIREMNRALRFYTGTLGGKLNMRAEGDMKDSWASVRVGKTEFWLIEPEKREKLELAYHTFIVKDIKKTVTGLKKKRVRFIPAEGNGRVEGPITYQEYGASAFFKDSEGNLMMLWQNP